MSEGNDDISVVIGAIRSAFGGVRLNGGISLVQARALDDCKPFVGHPSDDDARWEDIADATLQEFNDVHPFLCARGFRFYIPAFLIWVLRHMDDASGDHSGLSDSTVYFLIPPDHPGRTPDIERFSLLNDTQRGAVCLFLRYIAATDSYHRPEAEMALSAYWAPYCTSADPEGPTMGSQVEN